jgi:hypothetical protein
MMPRHIARRIQGEPFLRWPELYAQESAQLDRDEAIDRLLQRAAVTPPAETPMMKLDAINNLLPRRFGKPLVVARIRGEIERLGGELMGTKGKWVVRYGAIRVPEIRDRFAAVRA